MAPMSKKDMLKIHVLHCQYICIAAWVVVEELMSKLQQRYVDKPLQVSSEYRHDSRIEILKNLTSLDLHEEGNEDAFDEQQGDVNEAAFDVASPSSIPRCKALLQRRPELQGQGMSRGRVPPPLRIIGNAAAFFFGGLFTLSIASSLAMRSLQSFLEAKRRKVALTCAACKGKGFYGCKLCKGKTTIEWSPLYDPLFINPCLCPTCDGNKIQRCLNCLGKGYV